MLKQKNITELREILCDEIDNIRAGKSTPSQSNAITNATGKILTTIKMQLEYYKAIGKQPHNALIKGILQMPAKEKE